MGNLYRPVDYGTPTCINGQPSKITEGPGRPSATITDGTSNTAAFAESGAAMRRARPAPNGDTTMVLVISTGLDNLAPPMCTYAARYTSFRYRGQEYYRAFAPTANYNHTLPPNYVLYDCGTAQTPPRQTTSPGTTWRRGATTPAAPTPAWQTGRSGSSRTRST